MIVRGHVVGDFRFLALLGMTRCGACVMDSRLRGNDGYSPVRAGVVVLACCHPTPYRLDSRLRGNDGPVFYNCHGHSKSLRLGSKDC